MSRPLRIVDAVFTRHGGSIAGRTVAAVACAGAVHALFVLWATRRHVHHEENPTETTQEVELLPPPPPPPPEAPRPEPPPPPKQAEPEPAAPVKHVAPAQAGQVIARAPDPQAPVDLSGNTIVTGTGSTYAGGATTSSGTNTHAVDPAAADPKSHETGPARPPPGPDRSAKIALQDDDWTCPWPREADAEEVDEQTAVVRVTVRPDGTPAAAGIERDPGFGFGAAAVSCAMRTRFRPARARDGQAIQSAASVRVRFTR